MEINNLEISPISNGFNYGEGFFTTIKVQNLTIENIDLHISRIKKSLKFFSFNIQPPILKTEIESLLRINRLSDARIKIIFFKDIDKVSYIIFCFKLIIDNRPIELGLSEFIRGNDPIHKYKSLNYYSNLKSAKKILVDHKNRILETGFANIFIVKSGEIFTPPSDLPILPGVYREYLLKKGSIKNYPITEKNISISELKDSDAIFVTNSLRGIIPVEKICTCSFSTEIPEILIGELC